MTDVPVEPGMTWDGSYQQAYLRGRADAAAGVPVGSDPADPMPYVSLAPAWAMLAGYVDQAREDGDSIDPGELLAVMRDFKADAYKPVHDWWRRTYHDHPSPWEDPDADPDPADRGTTPTILDLDDRYFDGQTLPEVLAEYEHVHSTTGVCVKEPSGNFCATRRP